jgi:putative two-component system response regulator
MAIESVNKGAFMFLKKPFEQSHLLSAVERALEHYRLVRNDKTYMARLEDTVFEKTRELQDTATMANRLSLELVQRLSAVAEFRDSYTAAHISRIGLYSRAIAEAMGRYKEFIDAITLASSLHDIGKIGIPDRVLLKKTPLTLEERETMKEHTTIGSRILAASSHPTIQMAASIALNHHERWDGSGYPNRLRGKEIPIEARIVSLADQYDALRSKRSYKPELEHREAFRIITEGDDRSSPDHLDPEVLEIFRGIDKELAVIYSDNPDVPAAVARA